VDGEDAFVIQRTLRSGFKVNSERHSILIGDVNPGAEIISCGSIIVWGKMNGRAWAGRLEGKEIAFMDLDVRDGFFNRLSRMINPGEN
jgi:septum site-determining protein MinC